MPKNDNRQAMRPLTVRAATLDENARTVDAVISTEGKVRVWDWDKGTIDEVLMAGGFDMRGESLPLLATHDQTSLRSLVGSVVNIRTEGTDTVGTLRLASVPPAEEAMTLIREGHLTDVSVGYIAREWVDIKPGETRTVEGREYTAGDRTLRITSQWRAVEASLVPIGADPDARLRQFQQYQETKNMPTQNADAGAPDVVQHYPPVDAPAVRSDVPPVVPASDPPAPVVRTEPDETATRAAIEAERKRTETILAIGKGMPEETVRKAIADGLSAEAAGLLFLRTIQESQAAPLTPAVHIRNETPETERDALAAALMIREGLDPYTQHPERRDRKDDRLPQAMRERLERAAEDGYRLRSISLYEVAQRCVEMTGTRVSSLSREEVIHRAFSSGGSMSEIFTTSFNAQLLAAYIAAEDSTGWCGEEEVGNFMSNERISGGKVGALTLHRRGGTADHVTMDAEQETYKVHRYSGQWTVDEMDIVDDRFGMTDQVTPAEMGIAARMIRPNLVYATVLANGNTVDGNALFSTTHANYGTSSTALATTTIDDGIAALRKQRIQAQPLDLRPRWLVVPADLEFVAKSICTLAATSYNAPNIYAPLGIEVVVDDRMGTAGCINPLTGTSYAGSATNWLLVAGGNRPLITVGYLRGTGRVPTVRSSTLMQGGQWGMNFDVKHDVGVYVSGWRSGYYATGAS